MMVLEPPAPTILEKRIVSGADDIEQRGSKMSLASTDLEMAFDGGTKQVVGLRFTALDIPVGAIITSAYIQFVARSPGSSSTVLQIKGLASDDLAPFTVASNNLTLRPVTSSVAQWQPVSWSSQNEAGLAERTPDLAAIIQEIVGRAGWQAGSDLGFSISGTGTRNAYSFEGVAAKAPLLHIEYTLPGGNSAPTLDLDGSAAGSDFSTILAKGTFAVPIADSDMVITDANNPTMQGLTATLTNPKAGDALALNGTLPAGIVIASSSASTITLSGTASIADYKTVARQLAFTNAGSDPDTTSRQVTMTVNDGLVSSNIATATIAIPNAVPNLDLDGSVSGTGYANTFVAQGVSVAIADTDLLIADTDDTQMQRLTVTLANPKSNDQLLVSGTLSGGIVLDATSTASSILLTGTASIAAYRDAIGQVRFANTGSSPDMTTRQIQVAVSDGQSLSNTAAATISIQAAPGSNVAPVLDLDGSVPGSGFSNVYAPGGSGVKIADSDLVVTDTDNSTLQRSTISIISAKSGDRLSASGALPAGITVDPSSTATSLVLTGSASLLSYKAALQQILFDNGNANPDAATRQIQVSVNDGLASSNIATASIAIDAGDRTILERRIAASADDVEQHGTIVDLISGDIELVTDGSMLQTVGLRFIDMQVPVGAVITAAYIQFSADETYSVATLLKIQGYASDDVAPFTTSITDYTSRSLTSASASWSPAPWTLVDEVGANQRTTDLSAIVQEVVSRSGWQPGNDLGFYISGSGRRTADAFDGGATKAPLLHIEYSIPQASTIDVVLAASELRENVAGARAGTLSVANPVQGQTYTFSTSDARFQIVGDQLALKGGMRLDYERTPVVRVQVTVTDSSGTNFVDTVSAAVTDIAETRFAAFGDYGNKGGSQAVATLVNSLNVDFIVTLGDNVYGLTPSIDDQVGNKYASYIGNYHGAYGAGSATNRFFPSIGNHEYAGEGGGVSAYLDMFTLPGNELYYDFVIGPVHFFALDSNAAQPDGTSATSIQAQWLKAGLAASTSLYDIVFFHHPPFSSGAEHGSTPVMQWPFELWGATAVLSGHDHIYERVMRDDNQDGTFMPYLIDGMGGATPTPFAAAPVTGSQVRYNSDYGTILVQASDQSITFDFIAVTGGTVIDSFTIDLPQPQSSAAMDYLA